jgi:hypothetical protein
LDIWHGKKEMPVARVRVPRAGESSGFTGKAVAKNIAFARRVQVSYFASSALLAGCLVAYLSVKAKALRVLFLI